MRSFDVQEIKVFMNKLLLQSVFDHFYLSEMTVVTFAKFQIQGTLNKGYFTMEEQETIGERKHVLWEEIKPYVFSVIKGTKSPLSFHITLMLSEEQLEQVIKSIGKNITADDITGFYVQLRYENAQLHIVTGAGFRTFLLDKTIETAWDDQMERFLKHHNITFIRE